MAQSSEKPSEPEVQQPEIHTQAEAAVEAGAPTAPDRAEPEVKPPGKSVAREWLETVVIALVVAFLIRSFVVQVYKVEGESMEPTLKTEERLLVNKFVYYFRDPRAGEVIVLQDPGKPQRELIKRVVAVAGEKVEVRKGVLYVNDEPIVEDYKNTAFVSHAESGPVTIPAGHLFVMGDNRGRSFDSRAIGPIALDKVDGKAFLLFWPLNRFAAPLSDQPRVVATNAGTK